MMDRDTVRLILVITGILVLVGIYLWGIWKPFSREQDEADEPWHDDGTAADPLDDEEDPLDLLSAGSRKEPHMSGLDRHPSDDDDFDGHDKNQHAGSHADLNIEGANGAPFLIQISVVAGPGRTFRGKSLKEALLEADLLHGDMGIFHRYNPDYTQSLFSVASLVEPGTFPIDNMDDFECPGIVLFFQTARVSNPLEVYDDLVNTSRELANHLHAIQWDETRQPLSASKIAHMRNLLRHSSED